MTKVVWLPNETDYSYCGFVAPNTTVLPIFIGFIQTYTRYPNHGAIQAIIQAVTGYFFFWQSTKTYKKYGILKFFLINTGPYAAENIKVLFFPQFSLEPIHTL